MKRVICLVGLALALAACGPLDDTAESTVSITPNVKTDACDTTSFPYVRAQPNFCNLTPAAPTALTMDNTCRSFSAAGYPISGNALIVRVGLTPQILSANAIATRRIDLSFYSDAACANLVLSQSDQQREWVALVAAQFMQSAYRDVNVAIPAGTANVWYKGLLTACVGCRYLIQVTGYYD